MKNNQNARISHDIRQEDARVYEFYMIIARKCFPEFSLRLRVYTIIMKLHHHHHHQCSPTGRRRKQHGVVSEQTILHRQLNDRSTQQPKLAWKAGQSWYSVFTSWSTLARWSWWPGWSSDWQLHRCLYDAVVSSTAAVDLQLAVAVLPVAGLASPVTLAA